jgi:hypothetical protein
MKRSFTESDQNQSDQSDESPSSLNTLSDKYVFFLPNDSTEPVRSHVDEIMPDTLFSKLVMHRQEPHKAIPISCSRDVLRTIVGVMRSGEINLLGDASVEELFETMQATCVLKNPYSQLLQLDSNTLTHFLARNGFGATITTNIEFIQANRKRQLEKTKVLWTQFAHSLINWPTLRRAMRDCTLQGGVISNHVAPGAVRLYVNTTFSEQGQRQLLRCLCERIVTHRISNIEISSEQELIELFATDEFVEKFILQLSQSKCGPFWFTQHESSDRRKLNIDKHVKRMVVRILNEPSTDLEESNEPSKLSLGIAQIRKLCDSLYNAIPRLESFFVLSEEEPTVEITLLKETLHTFGIKLVSFKRERRTIETSQIMTFPFSDVQLDSMDAIMVLHFL